ncbi:hypothetical protein J6590_081577 [Homalodisca vitripennis]|nr:hypothetical protein J6590_081577 [Homalodisca vitripennis]
MDKAGGKAPPENFKPDSLVKASSWWHTLMSRLARTFDSERTLPTPTIIFHSRLDLSNYHLPKNLDICAYRLSGHTVVSGERIPNSAQPARQQDVNIVLTVPTKHADIEILVLTNHQRSFGIGVVQETDGILKT